MKMEISVTKCNCGAVTVEGEKDGESFVNSMTPKTFKTLFPKDKFKIKRDKNIYYYCDHCSNHWGLDICKCGSGDPVGECTDPDCIYDNESMQEQFKSVDTLAECKWGR